MACVASCMSSIVQIWLCQLLAEDFNFNFQDGCHDRGMDNAASGIMIQITEASLKKASIQLV